MQFYRNKDNYAALVPARKIHYKIAVQLLKVQQAKYYFFEGHQSLSQ